MQFKEIEIPQIEMSSSQQNPDDSYAIYFTRGEKAMMDEFLMNDRNGLSCEGTVSNFSLLLVNSNNSNGLLHRGVMMDAFLYWSKDEDRDFKVFCAEGSEVILKIGDFSRYYDFSKYIDNQYYDEMNDEVNSQEAIIRDVHLNNGWNRITAYWRHADSVYYIYDSMGYSSSSSSNYGNPFFYIQIMENYSFSNIQDTLLFTPNDIDIDRIITVDDVFGNLTMYRLNNGSYTRFYENGSTEMIYVNGGLSPEGFTMGMDLFFPSNPASDGASWGMVFSSSILKIDRIGLDTIRMEIIFPDSSYHYHIDIAVEPGKWQSLYITMNMSTVGWYILDSDRNGTHLLEDGTVMEVSWFLESTKVFRFGYGNIGDDNTIHVGYVDMANVFIVNKLLKFNELHEIYMHRSLPT